MNHKYFTNPLGDLDGMLNLVILNLKKFLYWCKCNKVVPTIRKVKQKLISFLSILLEMRTLWTKKESIEKIWTSVLSNNNDKVPSKIVISCTDTILLILTIMLNCANLTHIYWLTGSQQAFSLGWLTRVNKQAIKLTGIQPTLDGTYKYLNKIYFIY